jgi:cyclophilin family peptidyl-prolyl cis-trans isomerase/HEAT repeat protein
MKKRALGSLGLSFLLVAFIAALAGCATAGRPRTSPAAADLDERALLLLLADRQTYDEFSVERALRGDAALREALAVALGRSPDRRGRAMLAGLLLDDVPAVRRAAAFGLGELEDPEAQAALLKAVRDPDPEVGRLAVEALGKIGARVVDVAEQLLPLPEGERWARLLPALFRFKEETTVQLAEKGLARPEPPLHAWAAFALAREPRPEGLVLLRGLIADPDPQVRAWTARALGIAGAAEDLPRLRPLLDDPLPGPVVRALGAARALVQAGKAQVSADWQPRLAALLTDPRPGVEQAALEAAGTLGKAAAGETAGTSSGETGGTSSNDSAGTSPSTSPNPVITALRGRLAAGEPWERGLALLALAGAGDPRASEDVTAAAAADDPAMRARAAEAAAFLAPAVARPLLEKLSGDALPRVREAAYGAWLGLPWVAAESAALARRALADADPGVRATALDWLGDHPLIPTRDLGAAFDGLLQDGREEWGLAALKALAARAGAPLTAGAAGASEKTEVLDFLAKVAASGPYVLRREAGVALGKLGQTVPALEPSATGKDLAAYRSILEQTARPRTVELRTSRGPIRIRLECPQAPLTCLNFLQLARQHYFDGLSFHRVVPDFVIQGGDPRGDGSGGPGYSIRDEINRLRYERGAVGMALAGADTGGSQFFITLTPQPHLDGGYTVFGTVVAGMEVADAIRVGDRIETVKEIAAGESR